MVNNRLDHSFKKRAKDSQEKKIQKQEWSHSIVAPSKIRAIKSELANPIENSPGHFIILNIISQVVIVAFQEQASIEMLSYEQERLITSKMKSLIAQSDMKPLINTIIEYMLWPQPKRLLTETHFGHVKSVNDQKLIVSFRTEDEEIEERYFDVEEGDIKSANLSEGDPVQAVCHLETIPPSPPLSDKEIAQLKQESNSNRDLCKEMRERHRIEEENEEETDSTD